MATINGSATTTITVDTADVANSLTLSDANATLNDGGLSASLAIGGTLTMSNGTLNISPDGDGGALTVGALNLSGGASVLDNGQLNLKGTLSQTGGTLTLDGTISGGTIDSTAGTLAFDGGTLSGVAFDGPLNLTASGASVQLANGTTVVGSSGSGPGTINDTGSFSILLFDNTQTFGNATINLGTTSGGYSLIYANGDGDQVLTLASSVTVDVAGNAIIQGSGYSGDGIVSQGVIDQIGSGGSLDIDYSVFTNSGTIDAEAASGALTIDPITFTNSGAIEVANGDTVTIEPTTFTTTASSLIEIGANSSVTIDPTNAWTNLGSITLASGAGLTLDGSITTAGLGSITNSGGTVYLGGALDNTGQTLNGSPLALTLHGGTISGGTVTSAAVSFTNYGGTLSGVTVDGPLNLTATDASVQLANGTTVVGSSGSGPGTINVTGEFSTLYFDNTQTVSNVTINLGNSSYPDYLYENDTASVGNQVLTLATSVTVDVQGYAQINGSGTSGDGIVNKGVIDQTGSGLTIGGNLFTNSGTIDAEAASGSLTIDPTTFTNSGAIDVANGEQVTIQPTTFTTTASSVIAIGANSSLTIDSANTWTNLGSITLASGASLTLYGSVSAASLGSITNSGGTVYVAGTWNNSGQTLNGTASFDELVPLRRHDQRRRSHFGWRRVLDLGRHPERRDLRRTAQPGGGERLRSAGQRNDRGRLVGLGAGHDQRHRRKRRPLFRQHPDRQQHNDQSRQRRRQLQFPVQVRHRRRGQPGADPCVQRHGRR
jgi:hypothetical protein